MTWEDVEKELKWLYKHRHDEALAEALADPPAFLEKLRRERKEEEARKLADAARCPGLLVSAAVYRVNY